VNVCRCPGVRVCVCVCVCACLLVRWWVTKYTHAHTDAHTCTYAIRTCVCCHANNSVFVFCFYLSIRNAICAGFYTHTSWPVSEATVAYYAPHIGGLFNFIDSTGFIEGRMWYVIAIDGVTRTPAACTRQLCPVRPQPRNMEIGPPPTL